jgi:hypothetical protein
MSDEFYYLLHIKTVSKSNVYSSSSSPPTKSSKSSSSALSGRFLAAPVDAAAAVDELLDLGVGAVTLKQT